MYPACGTWIKHQCSLPAWTKESVERMDQAEKNTESDLAKNWDDVKNESLTLSPTSDEVEKFQKTNQFDWIRNMDKCSELIGKKII